MENRKVLTYLGFAARSRNLVTGYNTCILMMERHKLKLLILSSDLAENTTEKMIRKCNQLNINYRVFGESDVTAHAVGKPGKGIFGITDSHFAKIISEEIDRIQSEREVF